MFPLFCFIDSLGGTWSCFTVDVAWKDFYFTPCENMESSGAPSRSACGFVCLFVFVCVCGINVAERCEERGVVPMTHRSWGLRITQTHTHRDSFYSARFHQVEMSIKHKVGLLQWACDEIVCDLFGGSAVLLYEADCSRRDDYIKCLIGYDWLNSSV